MSSWHLLLGWVLPLHRIPCIHCIQGDSEGHSFSDSGSSGNDDGSIRVESASGGEAENCSLSACTQILENSGDIEVQPSGSEEERLTNDDTGTSEHVRSTTLNLEKHCHSSTRRELSLSNQIQASNEVVLPSEPAEAVATSTSTTGGSASPQNLSTDDSQRKLSCAELSPIDSGLSMNEASSVISPNTKARVRPMSFCLQKSCSPPTEREELSDQNQIMTNSNTEGASIRVRPTSLNLQINQIAMNSITKGVRVRPASSNLRIERCPPPTERDETSHPNQNSNIEQGSANVRPTSLNLQKHCPPSTENQIRASNRVASLPERAREIITSTSVHETSGRSASASGCANATNQNDSLEIGSSPEVYKNVDSEEPDCHSHLESYDHTKEHLHGRQALQLPRFGLLSIIPEETLSSQCEDQTCYQSSPSYIISSSECTSSVYSSEQGTNCGVGYLADVEDMDSTSLQSDLESDEGTKGDVNGENRNKCEPESIQEMMQRLLHLPIPPRMQWYNNDSPHRPRYLLSDDSDVEYFYIATVPPFELLDSPCSARGYICTFSQAVDVQDDEDTFGLEDEVMAQPVEHTDTPNSGYISNNPQNEIHDDVHQYKHETTV